MKILRLLAVASAAFFVVPAHAQNAGTVTNHAFAIGKGAGQTGFTSLLCAATELAVGQTSANPACKSLSGDVTMDANGVTAIGANKVTDGMLRQSGALSLIGRSANSTGNVADISAVSGSGCAYREAGNVVGCGQLATAALGANIVTNAKLAQMANGTTKCRTTAGTGDPDDCTASQMRSLLSLVVGTNVQAWDADLDCYAALTGTGIIRRTGSGTCSNGTAVANSELAAMANNTFKGNVSGSSAAPSDLTASQVLDAIGSTRGSILYRGASGWALLPPGTAGQVVTSNGSGSDPNYQDPTGGSGGFGDTDRRNFLLSTVYQSKSFASYRRLINLFATGFKGANDTANGINAGASSNYGVDNSSGKVSPSADNDSFTKVLLHFDGTNGSTTITDSNAGGSAHTWTASGATISTSQSKFGGASGTFSGTSQWVSTPDSSDFTLGSSDFTVDCWFYVSGGNGTRRILAGQMASGGATSSASFWLEMTTGNVINGAINIGGVAKQVTGTTAITSTGWHHGALVRTGNTLKLFIDGTQEGGDLAISGSVGDSSETLSVGRMGAFTSNTWNGFIDEFRLSVGVARWTSNFTPPSLAYGSTIQNMTLVTAAQTADSSVSNGRALLEYDNTATPTLNTDMTVEVTCDGASNWAAATLSSVTSYSQDGRSVAETADTACTAGTSFAARIKTLNNKDVPIYGVTLTVH